MSITLNAKGTSVPFFTIGKGGTTVYQGNADPQISYSLKNGDLWLDTYNISLKMWSTLTTNWIAPKIGSTDVTAIIPTQTGNSGKFLTTDGTSVSWGTASGSGTVTSVAASGSNGITVSGSPITSTGTISLGLGDITPTSLAATGTVTGSNLSGTNTGDQTITLTGDVTGSGTGSFATTLATVNSAPQTDTFRKLTVNAKGLVTATSAVASTDITTALGYTPYNSTNPAGYTSNTGTVTSVAVSGGTTGLTTSGGPVTGSGTITLEGILSAANGGTGQTSYTDGQLLIGNSTGNTLSKSTLTAGTGITITNGSGTITLSAVAGLTLVSVSATTQTASAGYHYALTNVALSTLTLPASPTAGDTVAMTPCNGLATNVIARNGSLIMSLAEDMTIDNASATVTLRYINSTVGWRII